MANQYVSSVAYAAVAQWAASTAYTVGLIVRQLAAPAVNNERCWRCTTAGTSGASEPTWILTKSSTTSDNGVVWTEITGQEAYQAPGAWAAPFARIFTPTTTSGFNASGGDFVFVASNHAETTSAALNFGTGGQLGGNPFNLVCVDSGGSSHVPPQSSDVTTGASVTTTGASVGIQISSRGINVNGIVFNVGTAASPLFSILGSSVTPQCINLTNCQINFPSTGGGGLLLQAGASTATIVNLNNTPVSFAGTGQTITVSGVALTWRNTPSAVGGSAVPNTLFSFGTGAARIFIEGVDLSGAGTRTLFSASNVVVSATLQNSVIPGLGLLGVSGNGQQEYPALVLDAINCDAGSQFYSHARWSCGDTLQSQTQVVRTGGASDGTTPLAWSIARNLFNSSWTFFFESFPIALWNTTVGSPVSLTIYGAAVNVTALPNNDEIWLSLEYPSSATHTISAQASGTKANAVAAGAPLTASTQAWDSGVTARANSTAYSVGDFVKAASNPGRVFYCISGGTSAASEPAGYATAVDGGSVTDGGATFRAAMRFQQTLTVTPQAAGFIRGYVRVAKQPVVYFIDPMLNP